MVPVQSLSRVLRDPLTFFLQQVAHGCWAWEEGEEHQDLEAQPRMPLHAEQLDTLPTQPASPLL